MESPFDVLEIEPDADQREVERAYKRRVKEAHPDHGGSAEEFRAVRAAYEELTSGSRPVKRETGRDDAGREDTDRVDTDRDEAGHNETDGTAARNADAQREDAQREDFRRDDAENRRPRKSQVEYLDYAVLDDFGWGIDDEDLFEKASEERLEPPEYGQITVETDELLLEAAEDCGFTWPYSCRGGACANCAVAVKRGEISMPSNHVLPPELLDRGIRLSCIGTPTSGELQVVYNVKHLPDLDELRLPPGPFEFAND